MPKIGERNPINNLGIKKSTGWFLKFFFFWAYLKKLLGMWAIKCKGLFSITRHKKWLTQAVAGASTQHEYSSSCVMGREEANAATVSRHAISACCSTASYRDGSKARVCLGAPQSVKTVAAAAVWLLSQPGLHPCEANFLTLPKEA